MQIKTSIVGGLSVSRDRLVVRTLRCGRNNPGSNPGLGTLLFLFFLLLLLLLFSFSLSLMSYNPIFFKQCPQPFRFFFPR